MDSIRYQGVTYYFNFDNPFCYYYECGDCSNVLTYKARDYCGIQHKIEYRIMGPRDKAFAIRMARKLAPWDVIHLGPSPYLEAMHGSGI